MNSNASTYICNGDFDLIDRSDEDHSCRISLVAFDVALSVFVGPTALVAASMLVAVYLTTKSPALRRIKVAVCTLGLLATSSLFAYVGGRPPPQTCFVTLLLSHSFFTAVHNLTLSRGMVLVEIFGNKFKRINATTRTVLVRALQLSIPDIVLTVVWFTWGVANGSISIHRSGFGCGHPNGQFLTSIAVVYRCFCVLSMLFYWKELRGYKHIVAEQTRTTLKSLAVAYYLTVAGLAITAIAPVDMARYAAYVISFSATLGLSLVSMFGGNLAVAIWPVESGEVVEVPSDILIVSSTSTLSATMSAVDHVVKDCQKQLSGRLPNLIVLSYTQKHEQQLLRAAIQRSFPNIPIVGASTCMGVLSPNGFASREGCSFGAWMICDPEGVYAVAQSAFHSTPVPAKEISTTDHAHLHLHSGTAAYIAGQQCVNRALMAAASRKAAAANKACCSGDGDIDVLSPFIWMSSHPGHEEELISGMKAAFGRSEDDELTIIGSSAADNAVKQQWSVLSSAPKAGEGDTEAAIALCWPSVFVKVSMFSAYAPQARSGEVTKANGRRIVEIDGEPAAKVLNAWSANTYKDAMTRLKLRKATNILSQSAMYPLGLQRGYDFDEEPWYKNIHPNDIGPDGSVGCFAQVHKGEQLVQMSTTAEALTRRVGVAAKHIVRDSHFTLPEIKGSLAVYCGGCMLAVQDSMDNTCSTLAAALGNAPYMGVCSFGEQGPGPEGEPVHANLMFCIAVFSTRRRIPKYNNSQQAFTNGSSNSGVPTSNVLHRRHSTSTGANVSPYSALAHFQGPAARGAARRHSSSRHSPSGDRGSRVAPQRAVQTQVPSSDTQFGDSVLYGMEEDIPVSPLSNSSSTGMQSLQSPHSGAAGGHSDSKQSLRSAGQPAAAARGDEARKLAKQESTEADPRARHDTVLPSPSQRWAAEQARATRVHRSLRRIASASNLGSQRSLEETDE